MRSSLAFVTCEKKGIDRVHSLSTSSPAKSMSWFAFNIHPYGPAKKHLLPPLQCFKSSSSAILTVKPLQYFPDKNNHMVLYVFIVPWPFIYSHTYQFFIEHIPWATCYSKHWAFNKTDKVPTCKELTFEWRETNDKEICKKIYQRTISTLEKSCRVWGRQGEPRGRMGALQFQSGGRREPSLRGETDQILERRRRNSCTISSGEHCRQRRAVQRPEASTYWLWSAPSKKLEAEWSKQGAGDEVRKEMGGRYHRDLQNKTEDGLFLCMRWEAFGERWAEEWQGQIDTEELVYKELV